MDSVAKKINSALKATKKWKLLRENSAYIIYNKQYHNALEKCDFVKLEEIVKENGLMNTHALDNTSGLVFRSFFIKLLMSVCDQGAIRILKDNNPAHEESDGLPSYYASAIGYQEGELHKVRIAEYNNNMGTNMSSNIRSQGNDAIALGIERDVENNKIIIKIVNLYKEIKTLENVGKKIVDKPDIYPPGSFGFIKHDHVIYNFYVDVDGVCTVGGCFPNLLHLDPKEIMKNSGLKKDDEIHDDEHNKMAQVVTWKIGEKEYDLSKKGGHAKIARALAGENLSFDVIHFIIVLLKAVICAYIVAGINTVTAGMFLFLSVPLMWGCMKMGSGGKKRKSKRRKKSKIRKKSKRRKKSRRKRRKKSRRKRRR